MDFPQKQALVRRIQDAAKSKSLFSKSKQFDFIPHFGRETSGLSERLPREWLVTSRRRYHRRSFENMYRLCVG